MKTWQARILSFGKKYFHIFVLVVVWLSLVVTNYDHQTWLTGWDNLHPEFFPSNDIWRSINSLWQEYQGVGLLGGMGHAADLPRQLVIALLGFFLPTDLIRYGLVFISLLVGSLGAFHLLTDLFKRANFSKSNQILIPVAALLGALFYLLNIGTIQNFYVPFEPFYVFFALLPWLIRQLFLCLDREKALDWLVFFLLSFLASPLGYIQTNFVVYIVIVSSILVCYWINNWKKNWLKALKIAVLILLANLYWLVPATFFVISGDGAITVNSHINQISTTEVAVRNQAFGNLPDVLTLRGYWFSLIDQNTPGDYQYLLQPWFDWQPNLTLGIGWSVVLLIGVIFILLKKRNYRMIGLLISFGLIMILLLGENPPFSWLVGWLSGRISLFGQIFRSPFTKTIVPFSLIYSILVAFGLMTCLIGLTKLFKKLTKTKLIKKVLISFVLAGCGGMMVLYAWPSWQGNYLYQNVRKNIPQPYWHLFNFMKNKPQAERMALLPADTMWGWERNSWGYRGIGVWWHGMNQAILNRAFDVWSPYDETFYNEISRAIAQKDTAIFEKVLEKYGVDWLIFDRSILGQTNNQNFDQLHEANLDFLLTNSQAEKAFEDEYLSAWYIPHQQQNYLSTPEELLITDYDNHYQHFDWLINEGLHYFQPLTKSLTTNQLNMAFDQIYLDRGQTKYQYLTIPDQIEKLTKITIPHNFSNEQEIKNLIIPPPSKTELLVMLEAQADTEKVNLNFYLPMTLEDNTGREIFNYEGLNYWVEPTTPATGSTVLNYKTESIRLPTDGKPTRRFLTVDISQPVQLDYFDLAAAEVGKNAIFIDEDQLHPIIIPPDFWQAWTKNQKITYDHTQGLQAVFYSQSEPVELTPTDRVTNCDQLNRGQVFKVRDEQSMDLTAIDSATNCESVLYNLSRLDRDYLLRMTGENISGRGLYLYLYNINHLKADLEQLIKDRGEFDQTFSVPKWSANSEEVLEPTYSLNFNVQSLAGEKAQSRLNQYDFYPVNLDWAVRIYGLNDLQTNHTFNNQARIIETDKIGTAHYLAKIESSGEGLIQLNQGFHQYWKARLVLAEEKPSFAQLIWPRALGDQLEKVKVNTSSNGWLIPAETCQNDACWVVIYFWPQYWGWLALGITSLSLIVLPVFYLKQTKKAKKKTTDPVKKVFLGVNKAGKSA